MDNTSKTLEQTVCAMQERMRDALYNQKARGYSGEYEQGWIEALVEVLKLIRK